MAASPFKNACGLLWLCYAFMAMCNDTVVMLKGIVIKVMVDCPHLSRSVCIAQLDLEQLKRFGYGNVEAHRHKRTSNSHSSNSALQTRNLLLLKKKYECSFTA
ncbi:hypothetical protein Tcan_15125 [Toxocara canis]|uniref:Uncharacterized protein n=1 Tax=Toxocara canis TaxID=6265 RepID=A0A0B2V677_TOXCA|nr:hypothetical protein Tcan_15125 [Toxocara canis]